MTSLKKMILAIIMLCLFAPVVFGQQTGTNTPIIKFYIPPDIYFDQGRIIKLDKIDINKASLEQLMALPQINEDLALKIMRRRPVKSLEELIKLPYINVDRMQLILQSITGYVIQPYKEEDSNLIQ